MLTGDSPVVVSDIDEGSPASQSDLRVGDIILEVDGHSCVMATHDQRIVNLMRKRVIQLDRGVIVRDQARGVYE